MSPKLNNGLFEEIERLITSGNLNKAQAMLVNVAKPSLSRSFLRPIANLACRADMPRTAIRLLNPLVRGENENEKSQAEEEEIATYAFALCRIGAIEEGIVLFESVKEKSGPESLFLMALAHITQWNYPRAIELLSEYVLSEGITPYQKLLGEVNLATSLVNEGNLSEAEEIFARVEIAAEKMGQSFLLGKTHYFRAEIDLLRKNPRAALLRLKKAGGYLGDSSLSDKLLLELRMAVAGLQMNPHSVSELRKIKPRAVKLRVFEAARTCDFYEAVTTKNHALAIHVYFGSPSPYFRASLLQLWNEPLELPEAYLWQLGEKKAVKTIDLNEELKDLKIGGATHKLLWALTTDFYSSFSIPKLFSRVYGNEFYNPKSTPEKVKQGIHRLRDWFRESRLPLKLQVEKSHYRLASSKPYCVVVRRTEVKDRKEKTIDKILAAFPDGFSSSEAVRLFPIAQRSLIRILSEAVERGELTRIGSGRGVRYYAGSFRKTG